MLPFDKAKQYEHYYYPALNNEPQDSNDESRRLMEGQENLHTVVNVSTNCRSLQAGQKFSFSRHIDDAECSHEYVITSINYDAVDDTYLNQEGDTQNFTSKLDCIPSDILFRTSKQYPRPTAEGVQTAIVCGLEGEEVYTDELGRVKVQFHWDRLTKRDENSSCWIRVAQPWAGNGYGALYIPRIGQEVMVYFEDGDINKPLIFGGLYNGKNNSAQDLPANKTQTSIRSRSSKGADPAMFNEVRFEDKKGEEELYLQAQKNQTTIVKDSHARVIGGDQNLSVGNNRFEAISQNRTSYIAEGSENLQVEKDINYQSVDGCIYLHAAEFIEFIVGSASLTMTSNGDISLNGNKIHIDGSDGVVINGGAGLSKNTPAPMKIDGIYTTPGSPGAPVPQLTATPIIQSINAPETHHFSREVLKAANLDPAKELHEVHLDYKMENGEPIKDAPYRLTESTGAVRSGFLDANGQAHVTGLQPGAVKVEYYPDESDADIVALRKKINAEFEGILAVERAEAASLQALQDEMNPVMNALVHTGAVIKGAAGFVKDTAIFVKEASDLVNPIVYMSNAAESAWLAYKSDHSKPFEQEFLKNFSEAQKNEVVDVLGFDPDKITRENMAKAYEVTANLMGDPGSRQLLAKFAADYVTEQDSTEMAEFVGGVAFEVVLYSILAAISGGVALAVVAVRSVKHGGRLAKLGNFLIELSDAVKKKKTQTTDQGNTNTTLETQAQIVDEIDVDKSTAPDNDSKKKVGIVKHPTRMRSDKMVAFDNRFKVRHLSDVERQAYKLTIKDGKIYDADGNLFDTTNANLSSLDDSKGKAIFTMDEKGNIYASNDQVRFEHHHSTIAGEGPGRPVAGAGELVVKKGVLKKVTGNSGHYKPKPEFNQAVVDQLKSQGIKKFKYKHRG